MSENKKQCLYCKKEFDELIEDKACEECAKKNTSYSCKTCGEKFPLDDNLSFQEAKQKAYQARKDHENQAHRQGNKCKNCGKVQGKEDFYLATNPETGEQWYFCEPCKDKYERENKCKICGTTENTFDIGGTAGEEGKYCQSCWDNKRLQKQQEYNERQAERERERADQLANERKWGKDFGNLKPFQREGRIKTQNSWSQKKNINFVCIHCQTSFPMDKSIENYLEARQKAQNQLNIHKKSCSLKNSEEAKSKLQTWWEQKRKSKARIIKTCEKCWGKVLWDKSIKSVEVAKQQALSDLKYHQEKECWVEGKKKIAIYHSPNSGGNEHASIDSSLTDDGIYNEDNEGEVYQEQTNQSNKPNYLPWILGGVGIITLIAGLIWYFVKKNKTSEE